MRYINLYLYTYLAKYSVCKFSSIAGTKMIPFASYNYIRPPRLNLAYQALQNEAQAFLDPS